MTIDIQERHILRGKRRDCALCPVGIAISEELGERYPVLVGWYTIWIGPHPVATPSEVANWIADFDEKEVVLPLRFDLKIPEALTKTVKV